MAPAGLAEAMDEKIALSGSRGFAAWLAGTGGSLVLTTYQAGKLILLGTESDGAISLFDRDFVRPMGLAVAPGGRSFMLATQHQIYRFDDALPAAERGGTFDAAYVPHAAWITGSIDAHDVGIGADGRPVFVTSLYSCIAAVSDSHSFRPVWRPPFISALAPEDRCHLNGMAMAEGRPRYATAVARTDAKDGWRAHRADGGVVIDVEQGAIVAEGLAMPHSPRLHDGRLWLLNSGAGEFGFVDLQAGRFEPVAVCPGYARGLAFAGGQAIVGLSRPRKSEAFADLPLGAHKAPPRCGLSVIDLVSGETVEWIEIGGIDELYDVAFLPGVRRPSAIGFKTDEIKQLISIEGVP
jgi:uncharacterized protein (TIGR03032 family)